VEPALGRLAHQMPCWIGGGREVGNAGSTRKHGQYARRVSSQFRWWISTFHGDAAHLHNHRHGSSCRLRGGLACIEHSTGRRQSHEHRARRTGYGPPDIRSDSSWANHRHRCWLFCPQPPQRKPGPRNSPQRRCGRKKQTPPFALDPSGRSRRHRCPHGDQYGATKPRSPSVRFER